MRAIAFALVSVATAFVAAAPMATAQQTDKLALARHYTELVNVPGLLESRFRSFADEILAGAPDIVATCGDYHDPAACRRTGAAIMLDVNVALDEAVANVGDYLDVLMEAEAAVYVEVLTIEELKAGIAFAESPAGRSIRAKAPTIAKRLSDNEYELLRPWMENLQKRMEDIYLKYGYEIAPPPDNI
jgi:hypothetical protein